MSTQRGNVNDQGIFAVSGYLIPAAFFVWLVNGSLAPFVVVGLAIHLGRGIKRGFDSV